MQPAYRLSAVPASQYICAPYDTTNCDLDEDCRAWLRTGASGTKTALIPARLMGRTEPTPDLATDPVQLCQRLCPLTTDHDRVRPTVGAVHNIVFQLFAGFLQLPCAPNTRLVLGSQRKTLSHAHNCVRLLSNCPRPGDGSPCHTSRTSRAQKTAYFVVCKDYL